MPLARRDCALAKVTVFLPHLDTCQRLRAALRAPGLSAAADSVRRLQEAACEGLEVTAARCLGAFRPDADAATAHFGRRSRDVVCATSFARVNEALEAWLASSTENIKVCVVCKSTKIGGLASPQHLHNGRTAH